MQSFSPARPGSALLGALLWGLLGAEACATTPRAPSAPAATSGGLSWLHENDDGAQRLAHFGALHETVRLLLIAQGAQAEWVRTGMVSLPISRCEEAVSWQGEHALECSAIAVGDGASAVLVLSDSAGCGEHDKCLEHSWVFLDDRSAALLLPPRRAVDYGSLRADLSREVAQALWLEGYRGRSEARLVDGTDPYADEAPAIASYQSCALSPEGRELVCRSDAGDVVALDPRSSVQRLVLSLERDVLRGAPLEGPPDPERVWFTPRGELALKVKLKRHPLCGAGSCTLLGFAPWPVRADASLRFVRVD